jgi:hypothetical protein
MWLSWLERGTHNAEVGDSSPPIATNESMLHHGKNGVNSRTQGERT